MGGGKLLRPGEVTLERALSKMGLASRTEARRWIGAGRVAIDGAVCLDPERAVVPEHTRLAIDGQAAGRAAFRCLMLHKPRGYVTTRADPQGRPTVFDLVAGVETHLAAVGRLDLATSGLLLFTNDTRLADILTDPANAIPRVYFVIVRGRWDEPAGRELHAELPLRLVPGALELGALSPGKWREVPFTGLSAAFGNLVAEIEARHFPSPC